MMGDNDPRANPWGLPGEMQWGEVGVSETPAQQNPRDSRTSRDPSPSERDFIASLETAHAPAITGTPGMPAMPGMSTVPPAVPAVPALPAYGPAASATSERDFIASLETTHAPAFPAAIGAPLSHQAVRRSAAPRPFASSAGTSSSGTSSSGTSSLVGGLADFWGALRPVLANPFPRNVAIGVGVAPFVVLIAGFILQAALAGGDWAHGGIAAGVDALLLALAVAAGSGLRYWLGRRSTDFITLASALLVGLIVVGGASLAVSRQLHYVQGKAAEGAGAYGVAVAQYKLYGEAAPNAPNVARADTAWGEQLLAQKKYGDAAKVLGEALASDPKDAPLVARASKDLYGVYSTWLTGPHDGMPYGDAAAFFATYRASKACDAQCQTAAAGLEAQTRFLAGTQLAALGNYAQAVVEFDTIQAQFPTSDYASKAHATGAQIYLAYGQVLLKDPNTCKGAVSTSQTLAEQYQTMMSAFQTLTSKYGDTPEGQQGAKLMAAPQPVAGTLTGFQSNPVPTIHLSRTVNQSTLYFSNNYNSPVDGTSGAFSFANVTPGDYNLHTERDLGYKVDIHIIHSSSGNLYNIHVGALCPLTLGNIPY